MRHWRAGLITVVSGWSLIMTITEPAGADFGAPEVLVDEHTGPVDLAGAPDGGAAVAWIALGPDAQATGVRLRLRGPGAAGRFGPVESVVDARADDPTVAAGPDGRAVVAWTGYGGGLFVRRRAPDGTYGSVEQLASPPTLASKAAVGIDASGRAVAAWVSPIYDIDKERVLVAWASPGEPFEALQIVTDRRFPTFPQVTVTGDGKALVSFSAAATATAEVQEIRPAAVSLVRPGQPPTAPRGLTAAPGGADESPPQVRHAGGQTIAGWRVGGAMHVAALSPDGEPSAERTVRRNSW